VGGASVAFAARIDLVGQEARAASLASFARVP